MWRRAFDYAGFIFRRLGLFLLTVIALIESARHISAFVESRFAFLNRTRGCSLADLTCLLWTIIVWTVLHERGQSREEGSVVDLAAWVREAIVITEQHASSLDPLGSSQCDPVPRSPWLLYKHSQAKITCLEGFCCLCPAWMNLKKFVTFLEKEDALNQGEALQTACVDESVRSTSKPVGSTQDIH